MAKRRITKASKRRLSFFGTISVVVIIYFIFSLVANAYTIYNLTIEKKQLENSYIELQEEAEQLKIDIEKFNDEKYLADYAREHYLYSKEGEYIIQMEELDETSNSIEALSLKINKNYIIIGLSILMLLIFIYILSKDRGKTKKNKNKRN